MGIKEYERKIGYGEDGLKSILEENLSELTPSYEESYILDRTRAYHNLLQNKTIKRGMQTIQSYIWDFNVAYMEEGEKEFAYLQDELGSTIRLLEQGGESQTIYGYDEFGEDTYCTQGHLQPFGYTGYRYDNVADTYFAQAREYVAGVGRFAGEDWIKGEIYYPTSLNQYGYCLGNPFGLVDYDGKKSRVPLANPSNANIDDSYKNIVINGANADMVHWYQEVTGDYKPLEKGEMYYADVSASLSASIYKAAGVGNVKGKTVLFDKDKYCIYDYGGFAANISYGIPVVDTTISLGVVRNVYESVDFKGEFDALYTYNILKGGKITATGVSARTGEKVTSVSKLAISKFQMSLGYSKTYYVSDTQDWIYSSYFHDTGDVPQKSNPYCTQVY